MPTIGASSHTKLNIASLQTVEPSTASTIYPLNHPLHPVKQALTLKTGRNAGKQTTANGKNRHLEIETRPGGRRRLRGIDINHLQHQFKFRKLKITQAAFKPFTKAAPLSAVQDKLTHQSGTGSQPQGVNGWQRSNRFTVSQPPFQGPCF